MSELNESCHESGSKRHCELRRILPGTAGCAADQDIGVGTCLGESFAEDAIGIATLESSEVLRDPLIILLRGP